MNNGTRVPRTRLTILKHVHLSRALAGERRSFGSFQCSSWNHSWYTSTSSRVLYVWKEISPFLASSQHIENVAFGDRKRGVSRHVPVAVHVAVVLNYVTLHTIASYIQVAYDTFGVNLAKHAQIEYCQRCPRVLLSELGTTVLRYN